MDAVVGLLDGVRARGAFVLRMRMDPPWSLLIRERVNRRSSCRGSRRGPVAVAQFSRPADPRSPTRR
ncbi:hypothetical protein BST21_04055 [Mycolicibacterium celeriflavum]|nr:hypothetical protein BST21_04055 [Mycolicibacterium celeriflavum]